MVSPVYSVVLDLNRNIACSGSMDGTVRIWNLRNGQCQHTLTGHTSLVGLLGLTASHLVSAAADSTLRIWDPDTGELRHTLAAHAGAITCFQHDEFKVLSGSDGTLKMWNVRDGSVVRDLLTGINGVWQVVFEGRCCVAASNRNSTTMLDVWDFGLEGDDDWVGEPPGGIYDDDTDEDSDVEGQADADAMDQDQEPSEHSTGPLRDVVDDNESSRIPSDTEDESTERGNGVGSSKWAKRGSSSRQTTVQMGRAIAGGSSLRRSGLPPLADGIPARLPTNETPTRPRIRPTARNCVRR